MTKYKLSHQTKGILSIFALPRISIIYLKSKRESSSYHLELPQFTLDSVIHFQSKVQTEYLTFLPNHWLDLLLIHVYSSYLTTLQSNVYVLTGHSNANISNFKCCKGFSLCYWECIILSTQDFITATACECIIHLNYFTPTDRFSSTQKQWIGESTVVTQC